jgi:hypothetical protein
MTVKLYASLGLLNKFSKEEISELNETESLFLFSRAREDVIDNPTLNPDLVPMILKAEREGRLSWAKSSFKGNSFEELNALLGNNGIVPLIPGIFEYSPHYVAQLILEQDFDIEVIY